VLFTKFRVGQTDFPRCVLLTFSPLTTYFMASDRE
jgi:hypothetical protein